LCHSYKLAYPKLFYLSSFGNLILKKIVQGLFLLYLFVSLSGCVAVTVVSAAVGVTTTVVGGAIDVVDAVTPDIIDDEDDNEQAEDDGNDKGKN